MIIRFERLIRLALFPFLSVASIIGTGYCLWSFTLFDQTTATNEVSASGEIAVTGVASTPFKLQIIDPKKYGYDGYRLVFDQGGLGSRFDEKVGVRLSTSVVYCNLTTTRALSREELNAITTVVSLTSGTTEGLPCQCLERIQFKVRDASSYLKRTATLFDLVGDSWLNQAQNGLDGTSFSYDFNIPIDLEWRNGMKPVEDSAWKTFMDNSAKCSLNHVLSIYLDNGIS